MSMIDPEALKAYVTALDALGFQPHFHAIGERAVREALDAVEAARRANGTTDTRPHIAHIQVIHPDDIGGSASSASSPTPSRWAVPRGQMDELTIPFLGPERAAWQYPFAVALARRRDAWRWAPTGPSRPPNPLLEMEVAVTRIDRESRGATRRSSPRSGSTLDGRARRRSRSGRPGSTTSSDEVGSIEVGKRRTSWCSIATCSTADAGADRRDPGGRHVHRRQRRLRGARRSSG